MYLTREPRPPEGGRAGTRLRHRTYVTFEATGTRRTWMRQRLCALGDCLLRGASLAME